MYGTLSHKLHLSLENNSKLIQDQQLTSKTTYKKIQSTVIFKESTAKAWSFQGTQPRTFVGEFSAEIKHKMVIAKISVLRGKERCILGYETLQELEVVKILNNIKKHLSYETLKFEFPKLFEERIGKLENRKIKLNRTRYVIPTVEEVIYDLNGAKIFSKLDIRSGFHQLELDEASRYITTLSTHIGIFRNKRLIMGLNSAPEIFQHEMESYVLANLEGVKNIHDDILVFGSSLTEHNLRLRKCLRRIEECGMTLNGEKCKFSQEEIVFFGLKFSASGVQQAEDKLKA